MGIRDEDVRRVREATDLAALIGRRVSLRKVGVRHVGLCPFHSERTPSFSVNGADGFYHCFGCGASGDAITYVRETEHCDFTEAVELLAAGAGIELNYDQPSERLGQQRRKELLDLLAAAADFYHDRLLRGPDAGPARAYLRRRGYGRDTVVKWRLGYAPPLRDALCVHLGAAPERLAAAGLAYAGPRGAATPSDDATAPGPAGAAPSGLASDFFRDRIMFPICDSSGRPVSFAGRLLPRDGEPTPTGPKYKNTAGTPVYDKSRVLYGLHLAKQAARVADRIVVCEGHTDVIGCSLAGIDEAVATCGTALTQQHAELLSRTAKRIVLAFDADVAGQNAAERVHQWEREYGLDVFVASFPPGTDPGDLAASDPPALRRALDGAQPLHAFRAERILARADLVSPGGRDRAADEAAEVLAVYPADILNEADLEPIARRIPMGVEELRQRVDTARARANSGRTAQRPPARRPDEAPPPPDPGDGYFANESIGNFGLIEDVEAGPATVPLGRRVRVRIEQAARHRAAAERLLLEAAASEGDAVKLMVSDLFVTSIAREAFSRIASDPRWREEVRGVSQESELVSIASDSASDDVKLLLVAAAAGGEELSAEEAMDRVATSLWHYVQDTILRISDGADVPFAPVDVEVSPTERLRFRQEWLRWLLDREAELRDLDARIGAAQAVASWLRGVAASTKDRPAPPDASG
ncbi:DNA primase [Candidatus Poriferisodalis sp.]|uniref:DNA primase n=1 Tax=Candidatus Poriferisodalis sp. TaxID=3101277 RepID=UPI003D14D9F4